jgi:F-type H+-transporting ATPase subunit gamma
VEPSADEIENLLIPMALHNFLAAAIEANAPNMQQEPLPCRLLPKNADNILQELSLQYNKLRQESITIRFLTL